MYNESRCCGAEMLHISSSIIETVQHASTYDCLPTWPFLYRLFKIT